MGTVFRIIGSDKENDFYCVRLVLNDDIDEQLDEYTKRPRGESRTSYSFLSLLKLMNELSEYNSVDRFAKMSL